MIEAACRSQRLAHFGDAENGKSNQELQACAAPETIINALSGLKMICPLGGLDSSAYRKFISSFCNCNMSGKSFNNVQF